MTTPNDMAFDIGSDIFNDLEGTCEEEEKPFSQIPATPESDYKPLVVFNHIGDNFHRGGNGSK